VLVGVAGHGLRLALAGVGVGLLTSFGAARLLESQLFGVPALEPWTFLAASFLLTAAAGAASLVPARRAARLDPLVALRGDGSE
jgi:putative ABC transport system permease protein